MRRHTTPLLRSHISVCASKCSSSTLLTSSAAEVLKVWNGPVTAGKPEQKSRALSFAKVASPLQETNASSRRDAATVHGHDKVSQVRWTECERIDFRVLYLVPSSWRVAETARENHVSIQCSPAPPSTDEEGAPRNNATVHGISLNCFAYHRRVASADDSRLLDTFLQRFAPCVGNSVVVVKRSKRLEVTEPPAVTGVVCDEEEWVDRIASRLGGAVCELQFDTPAGRAHGYCRAFFSSSGRFHYVVTAVAPESEFLASASLLRHAVMGVGESKAGSAF